MLTQTKITLPGPHGKPVPFDISYVPDGKPKPVVIFAHGFKGFKDWGHWPLIGQQFAKAGFVFLKFNFSHNGTTVKQPQDFADLEAFGNNNFEIEIDDTTAVLDWLHASPAEIPASEIDLTDLTLIGHSRGGGIAVIVTHLDKRVKRVITWASVHSLSYAWNSEKAIEKWKEKGVSFIWNGRTFQEMPLYFQLYENFMANKDRFDVQAAAKSINKPFLIIHGEADPAVPLDSAKKLHAWNKGSDLHTIKGADHVFGGKHPFEEANLPAHSLELAQTSIDFIKEKNLN